MDVHPSQQAREFKTSVVLHLKRRVPEFDGRTAEQSVNVTPKWLTELQEMFGPVPEPKPPEPPAEAAPSPAASEPVPAT